MSADAYLRLLKKTILRFPLDNLDTSVLDGLKQWDSVLLAAIIDWAHLCQADSALEPGFDPETRMVGRDWPAEAETMIGMARLDQLHECISDVVRRGTVGDLAEIGVWRGGAALFMCAALKAYRDSQQRKIWVADSFQGLPKPDSERYPSDAGDVLWTYPELAVPLDVVKANFVKYGVAEDQVVFLPGWFRDTLPAARIDRLALLRVDGDLYESTIIALESLHSKVSPGGWVIIDDYGAMPSCRQAVDDFRSTHNIHFVMHQIDWTGVFWQVT